MTRSYRFGVFEFHVDQLELTRDGRAVRLQRQPAQVLATLLDRAGQLVTRDELHRVVWGSDTFVDFERGLNFCIAQIRTALGDDAGTPRYIRTIPKKGYQFICVVEPSSSAAVEYAESFSQPSVPKLGRRQLLPVALIAAITAIGAATYYRIVHLQGRVIVAVARFDNETGDPTLTRFSDYLTDNVVEQLTVTGGGRYDVVGNAAILRGPREQRDLGAIGSSLHASYVVLGQVQRDTGRVRVLGHLIRLPDQTHVTVARFDDVPEQTLAETSEIAARMTQAFAPRVTTRGASHPLVTR
jgi:DNA-binding winged helix-turn-helix (wHTH) protein/TolB-like protein